MEAGIRPLPSQVSIFCCASAWTEIYLRHSNILVRPVNISKGRLLPQVITALY